MERLAHQGVRVDRIELSNVPDYVGALSACIGASAVLRRGFQASLSFNLHRQPCRLRGGERDRDRIPYSVEHPLQSKYGRDLVQMRAGVLPHEVAQILEHID